MKLNWRNVFRVSLLAVLFLACSLAGWAQWVALGPDGGDVRSLTYDPANPDRIFLGTSAGQLYLSQDKGATWSRFARLGGGNNYVLDHMEIDPQRGTMYVAAWDANIEHENGDLFRSTDGGKSWQPLPAMRGKSIRAMMLAPSDPRVVVVGALDGVFRSRDGGDTFELVSPPNHRELKNIESVAIDPKDPNVIYAGTWHLAWKTGDGGKTWHSIKQGVVDDSDVFSIIVDHSNTRNVYLSACSGIYKSENGAELFHKIQGIPFSARRTRVLKQDPKEPAVVYAGTTEGLWKTVDAGKTWRRTTAANVIINDIHIDPRRSSRVLLATDRGGVLASNDAGQNFTASNRGFAHRYVSSVVVDHANPRTIYAGLMNDKEFGGVYVSYDGGAEWTQLSRGLGERDVFSLRQAENGTVVAGTNRGIFAWEKAIREWRPINTVLTEKVVPAPKTAHVAKGKKPVGPRVEHIKSELHAAVNQLQLTEEKWFAATSTGLYESGDGGKTWQGGPVEGQYSFIAVDVRDSMVLAIAHRAVLLSNDGGKTWKSVSLPAYVTSVHDGAIADLPRQAQMGRLPGTPSDRVLWLATQEGALHSEDGGTSWEHVLAGLPARKLVRMEYQPAAQRLLAVAQNGELFASSDQGQSWQRKESGFAVRSLAFAPGRLLAATAFDGVIAENETAVAVVGSLGSQ